MLSPRKKLTKREIQEDSFVTTYLKIQKLFQKYERQCYYGLAALAAVIVIGIMMINSRKQSEKKAAADLAQAEQYYYMEAWDSAVPELEKIVDRFGGTRAAVQASFFLGNIYYFRDSCDLAVRYYEKALDKVSNNTLFETGSLTGIGACLENQGRFEEAAERYRQAADKYSDFFSAPYTLLDAGRNYLSAGRRDKAEEVYRKIMDEYPKSGAVEEAKLRFHALSRG
ncbi:tetratricopeptide repeat protein [bacterium]|nr:tetratricopeptide repeat protein [bacterium]